MKLGNGLTLRCIAAEYERREEALVALSVAFDEYLGATDSDLDLRVGGATRRLENAICAVLGWSPMHVNRDGVE
jgi:hypothetical protein